MPSLHVILTDDETMVRDMLRRELEALGYRVSEAANGDEALRIQRADPADVLLTDLVMADKEGLETIKEFRQAFPSVRIVAMSGGGIGGAEAYLRMAAHFGAAAVLEKPFSLSDLRSALDP